MNISFDKFEQFEAPILTLCNPNSEATIKDGKVTLSNTLGMLPDCKKVFLSPNFNTQWELSFEFSDNKNEQLHYMYKRLEKGRYIYVSGVGYFIIDDYTRHESDERVYKEISCHSVDKEIERNECPLLDEGSYYFYTKDNQEGIIQKQMTMLPKWKLGFVSDDLKDKTAYFDGENKSNNAYEFLWEEIEEAYECVIDVDFITRTLNFYSLEYYAAHHKTDIHLSKSNDLKEVTIESKDDDCFTAITVKQNDNLSLVYSNPNGSETLYNFTHCFSDMSPELQAALIKWQEKYEVTTLPYRTLSEQWANALDDLTNAEKNLDILKEELNNLKISRDTVINATASEETKQANLNTVNANISAKEQAIFAQENVIATKKENIKTTYEEPLQAYANECSLSLTAKDTSGNLIFTQDLLNELSAYINPAEYSDDYITQTDDMKYAEIYQQSNKLFDRAKKELEKLSTQSYTFSVENNSFLFNKKFERFSKQLIPGAIVYLETSDDHMEQVHLTNFSIDYDDCSVSFTFGNKYDENDIKSLFDDVFGSVKTSAAAVKYLKNIVNDQRSELDKQRDWIDNALTLTKNHFLTSNNQSVIIDDSGYWGRRQSTDADGNLIFDTKGNPIYDNEQLRIVNNTLAITEDNWESIATAIGKIYLYHDEVTGEDVYKYGVAGKLLLGDIFIGKTLSLLGSPREDGTYAITLNENGLTIINDGTSAGITIKDAEGNKQFYADNNGNLYISANVTATSGDIGGWNIYSNYLGTPWGTSETTIFLSTVGADAYVDVVGLRTCGLYYKGKFAVGTDGTLYANGANITGNITATSGRIGDYVINGAQLIGNNVGLSGTNGQGWAFWAGNNDSAAAPFRVGHEGLLCCSNIRATGGTIGNWHITDTLLYSINGSIGTGMAATTSCDADPAFWAGLHGWGNTPWDSGGQSGWWGDHCYFYVTSDGTLKAEKANITGTINATSGSFTGTINAGSILVNGVKVGTSQNTYFNDYSSTGTMWGSVVSGGAVIYLYQTGITASGKTISLNAANGGGLGGSGKWVYSGGEIATKSTGSDVRIKHDINSLSYKYDQLFDLLHPVSFIYNQDAYGYGTSQRTHIGFIANEVKESMDEISLSTKEFAGFVDRSYNSIENDILALAYEEFIALNTWQIQKLKAKIKELENRINLLEN